MRGTKTLKLGDREVEVYELTFKEIKSLFELDEAEGDSLDALLAHFGGKLLPLVTNLSLDQLIELAPSEAKQLWDAAKEVNAVFFDIAAEMGAAEYLGQLKKAILADCLNFAVSSLSAGTSTSGTTDTPTSLEP